MLLNEIIQNPQVLIDIKVIKRMIFDDARKLYLHQTHQSTDMLDDKQLKIITKKIVKQVFRYYNRQNNPVANKWRYDVLSQSQLIKRTNEILKLYTRQELQTGRMK